MTPTRACCGHAPKRIPYDAQTLMDFLAQFRPDDVRFARAVARTNGCLSCLPKSVRGTRRKNGSSWVWARARHRLHAIYARVRRWSRGAWAPYATKRNGLPLRHRPAIRIVSSRLLDSQLNGYAYEGSNGAGRDDDPDR